MAIRLPLVRRLGLRNAFRRPREAMLVMLGCALGTALIVGSGTVGTSFSVSLRERVLEQVGPIDARVNYENRDDWAAANARLAAEPDRRIRAAVAVATLEVPVSTDSNAAPAPRAKLIEADYRRAGPLNASASIPAGTGPVEGTVWASTLLARHLDLRIDDRVTLHSEVPTVLRVTRILDTPLVSFRDNAAETGDNLLVAPGTLARLQAQNPEAPPPQLLTVVVGSSSPDVLQARLTAVLTPFDPNIVMVRSVRLENASEMGKAAGLFLTTIGGFGILAGFLLLVNVLLMLAEERLAELGTMRAVGMARGTLIGSFSLESAAYALVGALVGGAFGLGLGRFMVSIAGAIATAPDPSTAGGLVIRFAVDRGAVANGIAAGFVVSTLVAVATSYRVSRLDVIRALRELPAAPRTHRRALTPLLVAGILVGPVISFIGLNTDDIVPFLLGMPLCFACIGVFIARRYGLDRALSLACGANIVWAVFCQAYSNDPEAPPVAVVAVGVVLVASGTLFANAQQARLARWVRRIGTRRLTLAARLGLANPVAHRTRAALTVGPLALVVFTLVYAEGLAHMITTELDRLGPRLAGDYQVFARSSAANPFDFGSFDVPEARAVARTGTTVAAFTTPTEDVPAAWPVTAFSRDITRVSPPRLVARADGFSSDAAVYRAVASDPDLVIVPTNFLLDESNKVLRPNAMGTWVGDVITMYDPASSKVREVSVAAVSYTDVVGSGAFYGATGARELFGDRVRPNSAFIATRGDPNELVDTLQRAGVANGVEAHAVEASAEQYFSFVEDTVTLYRSDLGIGLIVGVAGIGVVLVRAVRDRRQQIGTLRALGVDSNQIGNSFLLEGAFTAVQGIAVGAGLGVVITMALTRSPTATNLFGYEPSISAPSASVAWLALLLLATALVASVGPARAASRIPPAVALRLVD